MFRWVRDRGAATSSNLTSIDVFESTPVIPWWVKVVPFFISAFLFLSGFFAVFAPIPLLMLHYQANRRWVWLAAVANAALVFVIGGPFSVKLYAGFVLAFSLSLPEFLDKRRSIERAVVMSLLTMALVGALLIAGHAQVHHINPLVALRQQVSLLVDYLVNSVTPEMRQNLLTGTDADELKQGILIEIPSVIGIFSLILVWINLVMVVRLNPRGMREKLGLTDEFFRKWKAPEQLLWPTIITGFFLVVQVGWLSDVALNVFKFLMAIYAIQGLSILSFVFEAWNIRGLLRTAAFLIAVLLMMPLLLSLGFFDLWFDFRAKLRQS